MYLLVFCLLRCYFDNVPCPFEFELFSSLNRPPKLLLQPSRIRRPSSAPGASQYYDRNDMVCTCFENRGSQERPLVSALLDIGKTETLSLTDSAQKLGVDKFLLDLKVWTRPGDLQYTLPMYGGKTNLLLKSMLESGALPRSSRAYICPPDLLSSMQALESAEYVKRSSQGHVLTSRAIANIQFWRELGCAVPFASSDNVSLQNMTLLQLVHQMRAEGWSWSRMPVKKQRTCSFAMGEDKTWFTSGVTVSRFYLMCLLDARRLRESHKILEIPHGLVAEAYEKIFRGQQPANAVSECMVETRKRKSMDSSGLAPDVEIESNDASPVQSNSRLRDVADTNGNCDVHNDVDMGDGDGDVEMEKVCEGASSPFPTAEHSETTAPAHPTSKPEVSTSTAVGLLSESAGSQLDLPPSGSSSSSTGPAAAPVAAPKKLEEALFVDPVAKYGSFSFSVKQARSSPPYGGVEASCRWRRKNDTTGCKRFIRFVANTQESRESAIVALKHWCNKAPQFKRQRDHLRMPLAAGDVPPADLVAEQELVENPPPRVRSDVELDAEAEKQAKESGIIIPGKIAKSKAKAKPEKSSKGKAAPSKCKAKAKGRVAKPKAKGKSSAKSSANKDADSSSSSSSGTGIGTISSLHLSAAEENGDGSD